MLNDFILPLLHIDALAKIMIGLVAFIVCSVSVFAKRYLAGDQQYARLAGRLALLGGALCVLMAADNFVLFFTAWCLCNWLLVLLMVHKPQWRAAKASGWLAAKTFALGAVFLGAGFTLLYWMTGALSIQHIIHMTRMLGHEQLLLTLPLGCLLLAAMTQSAIWPFHRWLLSSLNSPTPVSAIMHAGLINGGGLLLVRFAPLYLIEQNLLLFIFSIGIVTALVGTVWKLLQNDIKRMLACSTMAQMGFMLAQCGLGLFPAALAHLCWHGLFKATLFLGAGSAAQERSALVKEQPTLTALVLALGCGLIGSYGFAVASGKVWFAFDTTAVLVAIAFLVTAQLALSLLSVHTWKNLLAALLLSLLAGTSYGWSVWVISGWVAASSLSVPQPLNAIHIVGLILLGLSWLLMLFRHSLARLPVVQQRLRPLYVRLLNASQPHPSTITAHRNHYHY